MIVPPEGRWPPVYDADDLAQVIKDLCGADDFDARFWTASRQGPSVCQGDVVELSAPLPYIDEAGGPAATGEDYALWLVIGNTCDFARDLKTAMWTQLVPLIDVGDANIDAHRLRDYRSYKASRRFYVPPWRGNSRHHLADFTRPVTVHKSAFELDAVRIVARLDYAAWVLLHSCLVRFLCRDDGRFD